MEANVCLFLKESIREVTDQLEQLEGRRDGLEDKCRIMRNKLEELEENAQEVRTKFKVHQSIFNVHSMFSLMKQRLAH